MTTDAIADAEEVGSAVSFSPPIPDPARSSRPRAYSPPTALPGAVTGGDKLGVAEAQQAAVKVADSLAERAREAIARATSGPSLVHAKPPSLAEARQHVHDSAAVFNGDLLRGLRILYGYVYLQLKAALHTADWVLASPGRLAVAVVVILVVLHSI